MERIFGCMRRPIFQSFTRGSKRKSIPNDGLSLEHFLLNPKHSDQIPTKATPVPYINEIDLDGGGRRVFLDVKGCQMNVSDAEVVQSVLLKYGYKFTRDPADAQIHLLVTCSIREGAENKVWRKLKNLSRDKRRLQGQLKIGILGCMAERLKEKFFQDPPLADVVAGPDAYKDLPRLLNVSMMTDQSAINVILSRDETYADVLPVQLNADAVTAFVSIQRGCDNMCSYCIVPFTRGRERSRPISSILDEVRNLSGKGVKEITLLGQNVNSYRDTTEASHFVSADARSSTSFKTVYKPKLGGARFADLLDQVSRIDPEVRIRFTSPHPKDFPQPVLQLISERSNICKHIHLPAQAGSNTVLESMRRGYTKESYLSLVQEIRSQIPSVTLSSDFIAGFCGESDEDFQETIDLIHRVQYNKMFVFPYSLREKTNAHRKLDDNVPEELKKKRFLELYELEKTMSRQLNEKLLNSEQCVLIEGDSKRSPNDFQGRADGNNKVIFPKDFNLKPGDYCTVHITHSNSATLKGIIKEPTSLKLMSSCSSALKPFQIGYNN
uniref:CDK5RAP1-like protein n=1 Tax=Lepeophtheirus salmonis TaxID=72036 RepID=A0A0K2TYT2_LEPSM